MGQFKMGHGSRPKTKLEDIGLIPHTATVYVLSAMQKLFGLIEKSSFLTSSFQQNKLFAAPCQLLIE